MNDNENNNDNDANRLFDDSDDEEEQDGGDEDDQDEEEDGAVQQIDPDSVTDESLIGTLVVMPFILTRHPSHRYEVLYTGRVVSMETDCTVQFDLMLNGDDVTDLTSKSIHMSKEKVLYHKVKHCPRTLLIKHLGEDGCRDGPVNWEAFVKDLNRVPQMARVSLFPFRTALYTLHYLLIRDDCPVDVVQKVIHKLKGYCKQNPRRIKPFFEGVIEQCFCIPPGPRHIKNIDPTILLEFLRIDPDFPVESCLVARHMNIHRWQSSDIKVLKRSVPFFPESGMLLLREPIYLFLTLDDDNNDDDDDGNLNESEDRAAVLAVTPQAEILIRNSKRTCMMLLIRHIDGTHSLPDNLVSMCFDQLTRSNDLRKEVRYGINIKHHSDQKTQSIIGVLNIQNCFTADKLAAYSSFVLKVAHVIAKDWVDVRYRDQQPPIQPSLRPIDDDVLDCLFYIVSRMPDMKVPFMRNLDTIYEVWRPAVHDSHPDVLNRAILRGLNWRHFLEHPVKMCHPLLLETPDRLTGLVPFLFSAFCSNVLQYTFADIFADSDDDSCADLFADDDFLGGIILRIPIEERRELLVVERTYGLLRANPTMLTKAGEIGTDYLSSKRMELRNKRQKLGL